MISVYLSIMGSFVNLNTDTAPCAFLTCDISVITILNFAYFRLIGVVKACTTLLVF